jgi:hypothetical protein
MVQHGRQKKIVSRLRQDKGHRGEWEVFAGTILNGGPVPIPYSHLVGVSRASFAALCALRQGGEVPVASASQVSVPASDQ